MFVNYLSFIHKYYIVYAESYSAFYIHTLLVLFRLICHVFILVFTTKNSELFIVVIHVTISVK